MRYLVRGSCTPGPICTPAVAASTTNIGYAPTPSVSSNLSTNGIVWVISKLDAKPSGGKAAILYAFDAIHLAELYGSNQCTNDTAGTATKFSVPTIANGKVYVGTQTELDVYGLIAGKTCQ